MSLAPATGAPAPARRRRGVRTLTPRDRIVAAVLLGIPLLLDLALVWFPAAGTTLLSFTRWNGVGSLHADPCDPKLPSTKGS